MFDIIAVGSATLDVFVETDIKYVRCRHKVDEYHFPAGSKILVKHLEFSTGGSGMNTAVSFARLGLKTAYLGKIGTDNAAREIITELKKEKVDTSLIKQNNSYTTGYSTIIDARGEDRTIFAYKGSISTLAFDEIDRKKLAKTRWIYMSTLIGKSFNTAKQIAKFARKKDIKLAFNASPYLAEKGVKQLSTILKNTDLFVLSREEAELLTKKKKQPEQLKSLQKFGIEYIAITDGSKAIFASHNRIETVLYKITPKRAKVKETTGAGDAFASALLAGIIKTNNFPYSLQLAVTNAQSVIQHRGAKNILLDWSKLTKHVAHHRLFTDIWAGR